MTPAKAISRSIWVASAARPASTRWTMSPLCVVPRLRAAFRSRSSRLRGSVMFFLTCVATMAVYTLMSLRYTLRTGWSEAPLRSASLSRARPRAENEWVRYGPATIVDHPAVARVAGTRGGGCGDLRPSDRTTASLPGPNFRRRALSRPLSGRRERPPSPAHRRPYDRRAGGAARRQWRPSPTSR